MSDADIEREKLTVEVRKLRAQSMAALGSTLVALIAILIQFWNARQEKDIKSLEMESHQFDIKREALEKLSLRVAEFDESLVYYREIAFRVGPVDKRHQSRMNFGYASRAFIAGHNALLRELYEQAPKVPKLVFEKVTNILVAGKEVAATKYDDKVPLAQRYDCIKGIDSEKLKPAILDFWVLSHGELSLSGKLETMKAADLARWGVSPFNNKLFVTPPDPQTVDIVAARAGKKGSTSFRKYP